MNVLELKGVSKRFGSNQVLNQLDLHIPEKTIFGFVGKNGAGKTTTMKLILGLLSLDEGEITVCGETVKYGGTKTNKSIGYLPDVPEFYNYMRAREYIILCARIAGVKKKQAKLRATELLQLVGLSEAKGKIAGFSRGMKQRLGIAQALIHEPQILICDEPTSALDPIGRQEILDILVSIKQHTTVLFSTHILTDIERVCDQVAVLNHGEIVLQGSIAEIRQQFEHKAFYLEFTTFDQAQLFCSKINQSVVERFPTETDFGVQVQVSNMDLDGQTLIALLAHLRLSPLIFSRVEPNVEGILMEVLQ